MRWSQSVSERGRSLWIPKKQKRRMRQAGRRKRRIQRRRPGWMKVKDKMRRGMKGRGKLKSVRGREVEARSFCELSEEKEEK